MKTDQYPTLEMQISAVMSDILEYSKIVEKDINEGSETPSPLALMIGANHHLCTLLKEFGIEPEQQGPSRGELTRKGRNMTHFNLKTALNRARDASGRRQRAVYDENGLTIQFRQNGALRGSMAKSGDTPMQYYALRKPNGVLVQRISAHLPLSEIIKKCDRLL